MATEAIKKPDYIDFLLSPIIQEKLGFHVNVGTPDTEVERIGCLRWMLIAHSKVLRTMLLESELKVGKEMDIQDLKPNTFKDFLTYIYGHDHTNKLPFGECIDLLAAAEKYDVAELKSRLAALTTAQVTTDNVCTVLEHGPVCETVPELWEKTTEIIQSETDVVFALPQFLTLSPSAVVHILQQDALSVTEIDVWRAALNWAKAQLSIGADVPNPELVRNTMDPLLRHTRLCTVPQLDIAKEVVPSNIMNNDELVEILVSFINQVESTNLGDVCSNINKREINVNKVFKTPGALSTIMQRVTDYEICTKKSNIAIVSGVFRANTYPGCGLTYQCDGKITIDPITIDPVKSFNDLLSDTEDDTDDDICRLRYEIPFSKIIQSDSDVELKMCNSSGTNVVLKANSRYKIKLDFNAEHRMYGGYLKPKCNHVDFDVIIYNRAPASHTLYGHHLKCLKYKVLN